MQLKPLRVGRVQLYTTSLDPDERRHTAVDVVASLDEAVASAIADSGDDAVAIIPEGPYVIPVYEPAA